MAEQDRGRAIRAAHGSGREVGQNEKREKNRWGYKCAGPLERVVHSLERLAFCLNTLKAACEKSTNGYHLVKSLHMT